MKKNYPPTPYSCVMVTENTKSKKIFTYFSTFELITLTSIPYGNMRTYPITRTIDYTLKILDFNYTFYILLSGVDAWKSV